MLAAPPGFNFPPKPWRSADPSTLPPLELLQRHRKIAPFVAKNGPSFEQVVLARERTNANFQFLMPWNGWHRFYRMVVDHHAAELKANPPREPPAAAAAVATTAAAAMTTSSSDSSAATAPTTSAATAVAAAPAAPAADTRPAPATSNGGTAPASASAAALGPIEFAAPSQRQPRASWRRRVMCSSGEGEGAPTQG